MCELFALLVVLIAPIMPARAALAAPMQPGSAVLPPIPAPPGAGGVITTGEVKVDLEYFGVGNVARRGDWAGVRLRILDSGTKQREVLVRIGLTDADGDQVLYQREITANTGVVQGVWLYPRLPFSDRFLTSGMTVTVHEAEEAASGFRAGRVLGVTSINPSPGQIMRPSEGLIGIVGPRTLGLRQYSNRPAGGESFHPLGHEVTEVVTISTPADLPDRWYGLMPMEALVWGQGEIAELRTERARSVREWVQRGGHLIIILPAVGQNWANPASNELFDILPKVAIAREEGVDLAPLQPLLVQQPRRAMPSNAVLHTFAPLSDAQRSEAMRIIDHPDGRCVVVRRLVGAGAVTLVGVDLNNTVLSQGEMIDADIFWNRILGRRGPTLDRRKADAQQGFGVLNRESFVFDQGIPSITAMTGRSAAGVFVGFVVFIVYWIVAGPGAFALLKRRQLEKHAWLAFVVLAAGFTVVAWGGASILRPSRVEGVHFTIIDHVYGQNVQRARSWASILIPWYGSARIAVEDPQSPPAAGGRSSDLITSWDSFGDGSSGPMVFPDARGYAVDTRNPSAMVVPARQTVKTVQGDWAGGPRWGMPRPVSDSGGGPSPIILSDVRAGEKLPLLQGSLIHELPAPMRDVTVIVVRQQVTLGRATTFPIARADAFSYKAEWKPGEVMDLALVTVPEGRATQFGSYMSRFTPNVSLAGATTYRPDQLFALNLLSQIEPPSTGGPTFVAHRYATHTLDLGRWMTQPCIIILGVVGAEGERGVDGPVPFTVDGESVPMRGLTMVRWVMPLATNPPPFPGSSNDTQPEPEPYEKPAVRPLPGEAPFPDSAGPE